MNDTKTAVLRLLAVLVTAGALLYFVPETHDRVDRAAAHTPDGFVSEIVVDSIPRPMDLAFAPDGRVFIATKSGDVRVVKNGLLLPTPFTTVLVNSYWDKGLLGIALDPDFDSNGYVYLFFTYENNPADLPGLKTGRLIRVTADGDVAVPGSELVLLGTEVGSPSQPSCQDFPAGTDCIPADSISHTGGALRFAPDGKLLLATGDAALNLENHDELILRSQDVDSLAGKLLRINPDGSAPADNPLYTGDPSANRSKVWAYGLRQPFRMGINPVTGLPFIGEVGSRYWEEINVAVAGSNFGWPCTEGYTQHPDNAALPFCQALFASETVTTEPLYSYSRSPGAAVIGGSFSQTTSYPEEFQNAYFFGDWVRNTIYTLRIDESGTLLPESGHELLTNAGAPLAFATGADGEIYYLAWNPVTSAFGELRHIAYSDTDQPPVAQTSASPMGGLVPLTVQFSSAGSYDPEGGALAFFWDFDDETNSSTEHPVHTFGQNGAYDVGLTVTDEAGNSDSVTLTVVVGNEPPEATISTPDSRTVYQAWDVIAFSGHGGDPEDGDVAAEATQWTVFLHHCDPTSGNCHTHPFIEITGLGGTLVSPDQGDEVYYLEFRLTVVDSSGLSDTDVIFLGPDSDDDGLLDFEEVLTFGTNYLNPDSDGDGISDGAEDPDADGCTNVQELGLDETLGGLRDPHNPWDFYDVAGLSGATPDGVIDLLFDILGVIQHYSPDGNPPYDVHYDRGPTAGPNAWNMTAPDGVIDLLNDILGVLQQYRHDCM